MTFNELRQLKDSLPDGAMHQIAEKLHIDVDTVRNYFGGANYKKGKATVGIHFEAGPNGGVVHLDDTKVFDLAQEILKKEKLN